MNSQHKDVAYDKITKTLPGKETGDWPPRGRA